MSIQTIFILTIFISIVLSFFSFFEEKISSEVPVSKPIIIEPIVIPKSVKEESNDEILEKLKLVTKEAFENAEPSEDEVAKEVLLILKSFVKVIESEKEKTLLEKRKEITRKKKLLKVKELARKKKLAKEKRLKKKIELKKKKALPVAMKISPVIVKDAVVLEEEQDIYTFSKEEEENFNNLEVVSQSTTFTLEETPKIKNPKQYHDVQQEVNLEELPLVETLGVINVSKPFLKP